MSGAILAGTASWMDPGFISHWYPPGLPASQRLPWYAEHFPLVEVNSTFYRIPEPRPVSRWCDQTPEHFKFDVKLHRLLSRHSTKLEMLPPEVRDKAHVEKGRVIMTPALERAVAERFLAGIEPLAECGKLGALLLQLSPAFRKKHHRLSELDSLLEVFQDYTVAVEFRNKDWVEGEMLGETKKFLRKRNAVFVMVDAPDDTHFMVLPSVDLVTSPKLSYLRAHGRNARAYVRERTVAGRFDHDYTEGELKEIALRAAAAARKSREVHVIYNNNKADYAPRAAAKFQKIIQNEFSGEASHAHTSKEPAYA